MRTRLLILLVVMLTLTTTAAAQSDSSGGWTWIEPGGATRCAHGTPYGFEVREGSSNNLLIFFEGGGACWDATTCQPTSVTFKHAVAPYGAGNQGIWDFTNPANPFADWDMVFIGYCTGDVHIGASVVTYADAPLYHNGFVNASAALDWAYTNFPTPDRVFISGESAGALGSTFHAAYIMEHYQNAPVTLLADSFSGARGPITTLLDTWGTIPLLPTWIPEYTGVTSSTMTAPMLIEAAAAHYPDNQFTVNNTAADYIQSFFFTLIGLDPISEGLPANLQEVSAAVPNFRYYTAGGGEHTILGSPEFYQYAQNGVPLVDWVAALSRGETVANVQCDPCTRAPIDQP